MQRTIEIPLRTSETADLLGINVKTLKRIPKDILPYFTIGSRNDRRYEQEDVKRFKTK